MNLGLSILEKIAVFGYFMAAVHYLVYLLFVVKRKLTRLGVIFTGVGFAAHSLYLILKLISSGYMPFSNTNDTISFFAWAMVLVYMIVERRFKMQVFGSFVLPLVFLSSLYSSVIPKQMEPAITSGKKIFLLLHVTTAFAGFASFALAFSAAVMYLIQENQLKSRHLSHLFFRLPSLNSLEKLSCYCISYGFPILTVSVIVGLLWIAATRPSIWHWKPVELWWFVLWVSYAVLLQARLLIGWHGRKASYLAIALFMISFVSFLI